MNFFLKTTAALLCGTGIVLTTPQTPPTCSNAPLNTTAPAAAPKIQAAILLDVSNSMDGLIEQAKAQLWNMVSVMGRARCNEQTPQIEIALYEYGRPANERRNGFVKQLMPFSTDLDGLSQKLFSLTTNGGDEYCGHVIYNSIKELSWDTASNNYKVIFICGNEDFLQGDISFTKACAAAAKKGVIVNTVYCGDKQQGITEHWNLAGECGNGSFTNIDANVKAEDIDTPYDSTLYALNEQLNGTYIAYGANGNAGYMNQGRMDVANASLSKKAGLQRIKVKGKKELYKNYSWDLVDAAAYDSLDVVSINTSALPDSLRTKSKDELKKIIAAKAAERDAVQKRIGELSVEREKFLAAAKTSKSNESTEATLETAIEKMIREQAKRFNMQIR